MPQKNFMDLNHSIFVTSSLNQQLFAPLNGILLMAQHQRQCTAIPDSDWVHAGVQRTLIEMESGCGFLQGLHFRPDSLPLKKSTYFEGFKSNRRLKHLRALNDSLNHELNQSALKENPDAGLHESLADFHLFAGDGHFHAASTHDPRDNQGKKKATGHLYALNLRTGLLNHLALSGKGTKSKKPHDMRTLKSLEIKTLRQGAKVGQKVLYIWDRAGLDYRAWAKWKSGSGIYFVTREKSNCALIKCGNLPFDQNDGLNAGVVSNEQVGSETCPMIRRVTFLNPENGEELVFLTNLPVTIPPGVIAQLYFMRWRIEKCYDVFKNKLYERKSWAASVEAKEAHASFLVLGYNLCWLLHQKLEREHDLVDRSNEKKRAKREIELSEIAKSFGLVVPKLRQELLAATQLSVKYWRWIRSQLQIPTPWRTALASLQYVYAHF